MHEYEDCIYVSSLQIKCTKVANIYIPLSTIEIQALVDNC